MIMDKEQQARGHLIVTDDDSGSYAPAAGEMAVHHHYMLLGQAHHHHHHPPAISSQSSQPTTTTTTGGGGGGQSQTTASFDKLSFSDDALHFADDFGPNNNKLALNQTAASAGHEDDGSDNDDDDDGGGYFFSRFQSSTLPAAALPQPAGANYHQQQQQQQVVEKEGSKTTAGGGVSDSTTLVQQLQAERAGRNHQGSTKSGRRKRPRTVKTSEEVESQRMTHIAVERNRRRQMNEYLRILRSLMPGSYVQRGDQASIIGGAIEFIRELEQLIQCLESQKRRRLYGGSGADAARPVVDAAGGAGAPAASVQQHQPPPPPFFLPPSIPFPTASGGGSAGDKILDLDGGLREEVAENKSCLADIEVRALGADALIKVLSRRRPGQLIRTIAALEEMQMTILHTNITTIEQTVLYSFNVKIDGDARFSAEDIAGAVHQILTFIDINYTM